MLTTTGVFLVGFDGKTLIWMHQSIICASLVSAPASLLSSKDGHLSRCIHPGLYPGLTPASSLAKLTRVFFPPPFLLVGSKDRDHVSCPLAALIPVCLGEQ